MRYGRRQPTRWCAECRVTVPRSQDGWHEATVTDKETGAVRFEWLCGWGCMTAYIRRMALVDPSVRELEALKAAGQLGGAYLEEIGRTDLATLTAAQWDDFLARVCIGYSQHVGQPAAIREEAAAAGRLAGEYLDSIGKTDLVTLTDEEWRALIEVIVTAWQAEYLRNFEPPF